MPAVETTRLSFAVEDARPEPYAQAPTMRFGLRISEPVSEEHPWSLESF